MDVCTVIVHHGLMNLDWSALAKEVHLSRLELGLSMEALAAKAGVSRMTVHTLERGEARTRMPAALPKIEAALEWPTGKAFAILQGRELESVSVHRIDLPAELSRSIEHAAIATTDNVTSAEIKELARRVIEDLRSRGIL